MEASINTVREITNIKFNKAGKMVFVKTGKFEAEWRSPDGNWGATSEKCNTREEAEAALARLRTWGEGRLAQGLN